MTVLSYATAYSFCDHACREGSRPTIYGNMSQFNGPTSIRIHPHDKFVHNKINAVLYVFLNDRSLVQSVIFANLQPAPIAGRQALHTCQYSTKLLV
eukprot:scaffold290025_cov21-Prasinocladus_malaysianus.AAC.1